MNFTEITGKELTPENIAQFAADARHNNVSAFETYHIVNDAINELLNLENMKLMYQNPDSR